MNKQKPLSFQCRTCTNPNRFDAEGKLIDGASFWLTFETDNWWLGVTKEDPHGTSEVYAQAQCPTCNRYCHVHFTLDEMLEKIFWLEETVKGLLERVSTI